MDTDLRISIQHDLIQSDHVATRLGAVPESIAWETCLRKITFYDESGARFPLPLIRGKKAYQFIVEVASGLHSPILGETEVLGQFRDFIKSLESPKFEKTPFSRDLLHYLSRALADAKKVRSKFLVDIGSQSYGSQVRRWLKGCHHVNVLGAGHLVQEILPWIANQSEVHVLCRNEKRASRLKDKIKGLSIHRLPGPENIRRHCDAWIIAAPIVARDFASLVSNSINVPIIDLRSNSHLDRIMPSDSVKTLNDCFGEIQVNRKKIDSRRVLALQMIEEICSDRFTSLLHRPFGWEDLCS